MEDRIRSIGKVAENAHLAVVASLRLEAVWKLWPNLKDAQLEPPQQLGILLWGETLDSVPPVLSRPLLCDRPLQMAHQAHCKVCIVADAR